MGRQPFLVDMIEVKKIFFGGQEYLVQEITLSTSVYFGRIYNKLILYNFLN